MFTPGDTNLTSSSSDHHQQHWFSGRVVETSGWLLFLLLQAYYSGALTMFLASAPGQPFHTVEEGLASPDWDMIILQGEENFVQVCLEMLV